MNPLHPLDQEEFDKYPAPLHEIWMKEHPSHIGSTIPYYGPKLYFFIRAIFAKLVVEIGTAEGYTSYFMANAITDNSIRINEPCKYIGIEYNFQHYHLDQIAAKYPQAEFWHMNSIDVTPEMFKGEQIDVVFQDGCHDTDHCLKELEIFYPLLKDKGNGYFIMHDVYFLCEEYFDFVMKDPRYKFEYVRLHEHSGLAICRKMDNYDYERIRCRESWIIKDNIKRPPAYR